MNLFAHLRGATMFVVLFTNLALWVVPFLPLALLRLVLRGDAKRACRSALVAIARGWMAVDNFLILRSRTLVLEREGDFSTRPEGRYLLLSNHRSWTDILALEAAFGHRMPFPRFFTKVYLLWVPFLNIGLWGLDYPIMVRYNREVRTRSPEKRFRDLERAARACRAIADIPFTLVNFPEGTRFTQAKHDAQASPYRHLLRPKAGGVGQVLNQVGDCLDEVLDVTLTYSRPGASFWQTLCGEGGGVRVSVMRRAVPAHLVGVDYQGDETARTAVQEWINDLWREKDARLSAGGDQVR